MYLRIVTALENDPLKKYAVNYFAGKGSCSPDEKAASIRQQLEMQNVDINSIDSNLLLHASSIADHVEIISLLLPVAVNGFLAVSMYCDSGAISKGLFFNSRATAIVRKCGYKETVVYGDAFIGRSFDDENYDWERRNFYATELVDSAPWILEAAAFNVGKNMSAYSSSGSMSNILQKNAHSTSSVDTAEISTTRSKLWEQNSDKDEIQILIEVPLSTRASQIKRNSNLTGFSFSCPRHLDVTVKIYQQQMQMQIRLLGCVNQMALACLVV